MKKLVLHLSARRRELAGAALVTFLFLCGVAPGDGMWMLCAGALIITTALCAGGRADES